MRKLIKSKKGDISAPIIAILLIIASIAIATVVISWMYGVGFSASRQANLIVVSTPVIQGNTLYITLKNVGNTLITVTLIEFRTDSATLTYTTPFNINPGETKSLNVTLTLTGSVPPNITSIDGIIQTTAGTIPVTAIVRP